MKNPQKPFAEKAGLFSGVVAAYVILVLHVVLIAGLGLLVLFFRGFVTYMLWIFLGGTALLLVSAYLIFRKIKTEGMHLRDVMNSPSFRGKAMEVSLLGGLASFRMGQTDAFPMLEDRALPPSMQLEDPETVRIRELAELARLLENDLITREEFNEAKQRLFQYR
jgi:hypothetical protein